ncbi:MAG: hypothetical protein ACYC6R_07620 [Anaerolineales bacterium]
MHPLWLHDHLAGDGFTSRFEWAQEILELDPHREEQMRADDRETEDRRPTPSPVPRPPFPAPFVLLSLELRPACPFGRRRCAWQSNADDNPTKTSERNIPLWTIWVLNM